jgi:YhcH/YjgK/YiaL family protein
MIVDQLSNSKLYTSLGKNMEDGLRYLQETDLASLQPGRYEIDGERLFVLVQEFTTKPKEQGGWEAHHKYHDIHCVVEGVEQIGYANVERLEPGEYDEPKDFWVLSGEGSFQVVRPGSFVIMMPQDAHMPGIALDTPQPLRKVVVKVQV